MTGLSDATVFIDDGGAVFGHIVQQGRQKQDALLRLRCGLKVGQDQQFGHHHLRVRPHIAFAVVNRVLRRGFRLLQHRKQGQTSGKIHLIALPKRIDLGYGVGFHASPPHAACNHCLLISGA